MVKDPIERDYLENQGLDGRIIIRLVLLYWVRWCIWFEMISVKRRGELL
jgi:hypothetical protein